MSQTVAAETAQTAASQVALSFSHLRPSDPQDGFDESGWATSQFPCARYPGMQQDCTRAATELQAILAQAISSGGLDHDMDGFAAPSRSANPICRDASFTARWPSCYDGGETEYSPPSPRKPARRPVAIPIHLASSPPMSFAGRLSTSCSRVQLHVAHAVK
eukprot:jgi/Ulvmu1/6416/UM003_0045.1